MEIREFTDISSGTEGTESGINIESTILSLVFEDTGVILGSGSEWASDNLVLFIAHGLKELIPIFIAAHDCLSWNELFRQEIKENRLKSLYLIQ